MMPRAPGMMPGMPGMMPGMPGMMPGMRPMMPGFQMPGQMMGPNPVTIYANNFAQLI